MSKIEWTEKTWNPVIGCEPISPGCKNCYAEKMAFRLMHMPFTDYYQCVLSDNGEEDPDKFRNLPKWNGQTHFVKSAIDKPLKRKTPTMYFVCSMGDLFHESVPFEWIEKVWDIMCETPQHTYQILTKRPERMLEFIKWLGQKVKDDGLDSIPSNSTNPLDYICTPNHIWLGVTAENQEQANKRIPVLLNIPAAVRFVSVEPMLGAVDFFILSAEAFPQGEGHPWRNGPILQGIDWVICGGESGPNARPLHPDWVYSLRDQCEEGNVPFFFKQWGEYKDGSSYPLKRNVLVFNTGEYANWDNDDWKKIGRKYTADEFNKRRARVMAKVGKKKAGCLLDGVEHKEYPKP